jgi:aryl-alcohol dehydrogenase-like predicted oxidoreductase
MMEKRRFGRTGLQASVVGFGGAPVGFLKTDRERVGRILNFMLDQGVNVIDTAASYEGSEELIAETIGKRRDQFVLVSKAGGRVPGTTDGVEWSAQQIAASVDRSLKRLRTDYVDVILLHSCPLEVLERGEALGALVKARDAGKIRFAGYSGDNEAAAYAATLADVAVIETSINITDQANIDSVLPIAAKHDVGLIAKRPIANAAWKTREQQPGGYADYAAPYSDRLQKMNLQPADLGFAPDAWPEIALRFTLSHAQVHTAIIGTTNPANAKANIDAAAKGKLADDVVKKTRAAFKHADPVGAWPGLT